MSVELVGQRGIERGYHKYYKDWATYCPRDVWTSRVTRVDVAGHRQFRANNAYLNSSSHTTWSTAGNTRLYFDNYGEYLYVIFQ